MTLPTTSRFYFDIDFNDTAGTMSFNKDVGVYGKISNAENATINILDNGTVAFTTTELGTVGNINIGNSSLQVSNSNNFSRNINFTKNKEGIIYFSNNSTISGIITNGDSAVLNLNANLTASHPSIGTVNQANIQNNVTYTIDAKNDDVDLLNNGAKIVFKGKNSGLHLVNISTTDDRIFTLYANLNPSNTTDNYGIVRINSTEKALTIGNNGVPFTIGKDNTHRLKEFIVEGAGDIVVDNKVFTKLLNMNSTGQVTLNQNLDLGVGGNRPLSKLAF